MYIYVLHSGTCIANLDLPTLLRKYLPEFVQVRQACQQVVTLQVRCMEALLKSGAIITQKQLSLIIHALPTLEDLKVPLLPHLQTICLSLL